jgi:hypothetical protein
MKRIIFIIPILFCYIGIINAIGELPEVYLNPISGNDTNSGAISVYPVKTWDKALSLAANDATIYVTWSPIPITSNTTINGNQYGAANITVAPNSDYTGALFAVADGVTGTFSNITLKGAGSERVLLTINNGATASFGSNVDITEMGQIALEREANPINLTATPAAGVQYHISTNYTTATDEGRAIVNAGSVSNPVQYFNLAYPQSASEVGYELRLDGSVIRLHELPIGGIYLDPLSGNDTYSGAKSNRPVKTLEYARSLWNERNTASPGIVTDIFVLSRITLTGNTVLDGDIKLTRFGGDTDRALQMNDYMIVFSEQKLTINNAAIDNGTVSGVGLYSLQYGKINLNNGAVLTSRNSSYLISGNYRDTIAVNPGVIFSDNTGYTIYLYNGGVMNIDSATFTKDGTSGYCIYSYNSRVVINNTSITTKGQAIVGSSGTVEINNCNITSLSTTTSYYAIQNSCNMTINNCRIEATGQAPAIYSTSTLKLNADTIISSNTLNGAIRTTYLMEMNGEDVIIQGIINYATTNIDQYYITITSPTVTKDYTLRISAGSTYSAIVRSNPSINLGPYLTKFTLEPIQDYALTAYVQKEGANKNIALYNPNAIYVNDSTGIDTNDGLTPEYAVKTLTTAATIISNEPTKSKIFICDSTLTISNTQDISFSTPKDTILPYLFRTTSTNLINVTSTGSLSLKNVALATNNTYFMNYIIRNSGNLVMDSGSTIFTYSAVSNSKIGIYQTDNGTLLMKNDSRISSNPQGNYNGGYAIYQVTPGTGATSTLESGAIIERQSYAANISNGTFNINGAIIRNNTSTVLNITNGTLNINGASIRNNSTSGRVLNATGVNTTVNMSSGEIVDNSTSSDAFIYLSQSTFNLSGGLIERNRSTAAAIYGEQVYLVSGAKMNFTGGTVNGYSSTRNTIMVQGSGTEANSQTHLTLSNAAVIDSGFIYADNPVNAPVSLSEILDQAKIFNINLGDGMAGSVLVDGTTNSTPADVNNFILNPDLTDLTLNQSGYNVIVGSSAVYLNGSTGNDTYDGSTAALAVKTFNIARQRLQALQAVNANANTIIILGTVNLNASGEISSWDLSFDPNAVVKRALGYTGYLVQVPSGYSLTLSDITIDGNKDNVIGSTSSINIYNLGNLTINPGTVLKNSYYYGIYNSGGNITMTGGRIINSRSHGIYSIPSSKVITIAISGGEISNNSGYGLYHYATNSSYISSIQISDSAKIINNTSYGIYTSYSDLTVSGGLISNNSSYGIYASYSDVTVSGGLISNNGSYGIYVSSGNSFVLSGGEISNNSSIGVYITTYPTVSISGGQVKNNRSYGLYLTNCTNITIDDDIVSEYNTSHGLYINNAAGINGNLTMNSGRFANNNGYGVYLMGYIGYNISGNVLISNNKNSGIYSDSFIESSIAGDVIISGNRASTGGGLYVNKGTVNVLNNVLFEADTCNSYGGGISVTANGVVNISGDVRIKDCVSTYTAATYGASAMYVLGKLNMTGGSITGCKAETSSGTVFSNGNSSAITLTKVNINNNISRYGGGVYIGAGGKITLSADTIRNNISTYMLESAPRTAGIHVQGGAMGKLYLRDNCVIGDSIYLNNRIDTIVVDEGLLFTNVGAFRLLANSAIANVVGTVVVSPNGTTVSDASQFLTRFTLVNSTVARGLDKGGTGDKHIIIVNQYFIDGTKDGGNGSSPYAAFKYFSQLPASIFNSPYNTVWVSGPVSTVANYTMPSVTANNVNLRRYTGFEVAAQPFPAYDGVMFIIQPGHTLTVNGGSSAANRFTISGEGGSALYDASIFKNEGTLTIGGFTTLYFNPIAGNGAAVYQNGTFNLSGNVDFNLYSSNTIYLPENRIINITGAIGTGLSPIGITVETSPANTHYPNRLVARGTTTNVPADTQDKFLNETTSDPLPIGRTVSGTTADLVLYLADRNVAERPVYFSLQDAFDAAVPSGNDEVRLYGNTEESVIVDKTLKYNSKKHSVIGSFTLDSTSNVQLLDTLYADTLFIRANTFAGKAQLDRNAFNAKITKAAYLDLRLPENVALGEWYPVNLPFDANLADIRDYSDDSNPLTYLHDYAIADFDGQRRATYGIGNRPDRADNDWQYLAGALMNNGVGYMVTTKGLRTLRFKAADPLNLFATTTASMIFYLGAAGPQHQGWKYTAQPTGINSTIGGISGHIQVSRDLSSDRIGAASYVTMTVDPSPVIAPYTNYFYQTTADATVSYTKFSAAATVRSGVPGVSERKPDTDTRSSETPSYYELRFYADDEELYDALFVAANEYASKDNYEIGRDLAKMGASDRVHRIWSYDFGTPLCVNEAALENGQARIPLFLNTPVAGKSYRLKLVNNINDKDEIWLCRNDNPVQNLSKLPQYTFEGVGGTIDEYSLKILSGATRNDILPVEIYVYSQNNELVIVGLNQGDEYRIFDMSGRMFKQGKAEGNITKTSVSTGSYVIHTNGKTFKTVVK